MESASKPRIFVDYNGWLRIDGQFVLVLDSVRTNNEMKALDSTISDGSEAIFYAEDADVDGNNCILEGFGVLKYDTLRNCWIAIMDEGSIRHIPLAAELPKPVAPKVFSKFDEVFKPSEKVENDHSNQ